MSTDVSHKIQDEKRFVLAAEQFAAEAHKGQFRKGGEPYIEHPRRVAKAVADHLASRGIHSDFPVQAAYLHDVLEDTDATLDQLREQFSPPTVSLVQYLTRNKNETYANYIYRVRRSVDDARLIKRCDLLDNLRDLSPGHQRDKYELALLILEGKV